MKGENPMNINIDIEETNNKVGNSKRNTRFKTKQRSRRYSKRELLRKSGLIEETKFIKTETEMLKDLLRKQEIPITLKKEYAPII